MGRIVAFSGPPMGAVLYNAASRLRHEVDHCNVGTRKALGNLGICCIRPWGSNYNIAEIPEGEAGATDAVLAAKRQAGEFGSGS